MTRKLIRGGRSQGSPEIIFGKINDNTRLRITTEQGAYRLFYLAVEGKFYSS